MTSIPEMIKMSGDNLDVLDLTPFNEPVEVKIDKLTEEQHLAVKVAASQAGMTMQDYVVHRLTPPIGYTEVGFVDPKELAKIKIPGETVQVHSTPPQKNNSFPQAETTNWQEAGVDPSGELACCKKAQPCKHWQWDGVEQAYVNTISGRKKEV